MSVGEWREKLDEIARLAAKAGPSFQSRDATVSASPSKAAGGGKGPGPGPEGKGKAPEGRGSAAEKSREQEEPGDAEPGELGVERAVQYWKSKGGASGAACVGGCAVSLAPYSERRSPFLLQRGPARTRTCCPRPRPRAPGCARRTLPPPQRTPWVEASPAPWEGCSRASARSSPAATSRRAGRLRRLCSSAVVPAVRVVHVLCHAFISHHCFHRSITRSQTCTTCRSARCGPPSRLRSCDPIRPRAMLAHAARMTLPRPPVPTGQGRRDRRGEGRAPPRAPRDRPRVLRLRRGAREDRGRLPGPRGAQPDPEAPPLAVPQRAVGDAVLDVAHGARQRERHPGAAAHQRPLPGAPAMPSLLALA